MKKNSGEIMTIVSAIIIVVAVVIGSGAHYFSKKNDSVLEQVAESVLETEGVKIDFSAVEKAQAVTDATKSD